MYAASAQAPRLAVLPADLCLADPRRVLILVLCFLEKLEAVTTGAIVYDAGLCAEARQLLRKRRITVVR